jgi:hypothetical protein
LPLVVIVNAPVGIIVISPPLTSSGGATIVDIAAVPETHKICVNGAIEVSDGIVGIEVPMSANPT